MGKLATEDAGLGFGSGSLNDFTVDAWGSPFLLDENKGEFSATDCRHDLIWSAGPDKIHETADDIFPYGNINL